MGLETLRLLPPQIPFPLQWSPLSEQQVLREIDLRVGFADVANKYTRCCLNFEFYINVKEWILTHVYMKTEFNLYLVFDLFITQRKGMCKSGSFV